MAFAVSVTFCEPFCTRPPTIARPSQSSALVRDQSSLASFLMRSGHALGSFRMSPDPARPRACSTTPWE